jgi:hypothetical protein
MDTKNREACVDHGNFFTQCPNCPELPLPPVTEPFVHAKADHELRHHEADNDQSFSSWGPIDAFVTYPAVASQFEGNSPLATRAPRRKKLLVLGYGRHGKDSVAELLVDRGYTVIASSFFIAEKVMMPYFASIGKPYASVEECFADRHTANNRAIWYDQISAYNTPNKDRLPSEIMQVADVYIGMRADDEYQASRYLFDAVLWVDSSARGIPPEDVSSMDIKFDPKTMIYISNNGTIEDLMPEVMRTMSIIEKVGTGS